MGKPYEPSRDLAAKIARRVTPFLSRRVVPVALERPMVSITFDDCPLSALTHGAQILEQHGARSTIYVSGSLLGTENHHGPQATSADIRAVAAAGHEIGGHTFSHIDGQQTERPEFLADIDQNLRILADMGLTDISTFAYPYGQTTPGLKTALSGRFKALRGITPGTHTTSVDLNQVRSYPFFAGQRAARALDAIRALKTSPGWVTVFTHDVREDCSDWGCRPADINRLIGACQDIDAEIVTVAEAVSRLTARSS